MCVSGFPLMGKAAEGQSCLLTAGFASLFGLVLRRSVLHRALLGSGDGGPCVQAVSSVGALTLLSLGQFSASPGSWRQCSLSRGPGLALRFCVVFCLPVLWWGPPVCSSSCPARTSVSEGVLLMYPWREMSSTSTHSSAVLFSQVVVSSLFKNLFS